MLTPERQRLKEEMEAAHDKAWKCQQVFNDARLGKRDWGDVLADFNAAWAEYRKAHAAFMAREPEINCYD